MFDDLAHFKDWWLATRPFNAPLNNALSHDRNTHGVVLYRQDPYQVELFNVKPNSEIVPHIHPNVDSFEVFINGDIVFKCNDVSYTNTNIGDSLRVLPNSYHSGTIGERGACFLSVQKWLNGIEPKFIGNDWSDKNGTASYKESEQG